MEAMIRAKVVDSLAELDAALTLRWQVFVQELDYLDQAHYPAGRESDGFDTLPTTRHLIGFDDDRPVATVRLLFPNPEVAQIGGGAGLNIDRAVRFDGFAPDDLPIEIPRSCVVRSHRHSGVMLHLYRLAYAESRQGGATHWLAVGNTGTDSRDDAWLIYELARRRGHADAPQAGRNLAPDEGPATPRLPFYTPEQRARGLAGDLEGLPYPRALDLFAWIGARYVAPPLWDSSFRVYALPLVCPLAGMPAEITGETAAAAAA
jgi:L-ornithine Nalpha-acyltransferase